MMLKNTPRLSLCLIAFCCSLLTGFANAETIPERVTSASNVSPLPEVIDLEKPPTLTVTPKTTENTAQVANVSTAVVDPLQIATIAKTPVNSVKPAKSLQLRLLELEAEMPLNIDDPTPLDLSVPFKGDSSAALLSKKNGSPESKKLTIFTPDDKPKTQSVRVDGSVLMSKELEAEKRNSVDGAGITINLKP